MRCSKFGHSTLRLAALVRQAGQGAAAVDELWPLVARLEARAADGVIDRDTLLLLARARAELGVSLGYVLPEERLAFAVRWTGRALRIAAYLDDTDLHAYTLRAHGNELRKANRTNAARMHLAHAVALASPSQRPPALVQLARTARDRATFDQVMDDLRRSQERHATDDPLITATALREVQLRGLVATHRVRQATKVLEQPRPPHEQATPQWRVIEQITVAAVLFATGDATTAEPLLCDAITAAERHRLPRQIQRALRTATGHSSTSVTAAAAALNRITTPTPEQRTGRRT
jgi:hypothetical protein